MESKLFGCAELPEDEPGFRKASVEAFRQERVGDVFAIPGQEEVHAVNPGGSQVKGIASGYGREDAASDQVRGESGDLLIEIEQRQTSEKLHAFRRFGRFPFGGFIEDELGGVEIKLVPPGVPPFAGEFLPGEVDDVAGGTGDVVARDGCFR